MRIGIVPRAPARLPLSIFTAITSTAAAAVLTAGSASADEGGTAASIAAVSSPAVSAGVTSSASTPMPRVYAPTRPRDVSPKYPWREDIVTTIFWIGERPTDNNPTPNHMSSWDSKWAERYGGYDDPDPQSRTWDFCPKEFTPRLNPFYIALPYNDIVNYKLTKPEARRVIPWFQDRFERHGKSVCKSRWIAIRYGKKICYAQWEDCGPWHTDDHEYVFEGKQPKNANRNGGAALDISPAVRDYLGLASGARCDWRFVDVEEVPPGPWQKYGENNDFVQNIAEAKEDQMAEFEKLRQLREQWLKKHRPGGS